ncbi:hypothetical protein BJY00DRAFT_271027 [Aspergillus carlsbadensis]|nr:hypothetical protein BJY00DRAFT_271027 [Aspergillus carlsbadensis]
MDHPQPPRAGRQKRRRVPDSLRKRASQACLPCRRHKEKCQGGSPCLRCQQYKRVCRFESPPREIQQPGAVAAPIRPAGMSAQQSERERQMERIIWHFIGSMPYDTHDLEEIANELENTHQAVPFRDHSDGEEDNTLSGGYSLEPLSTSTMHYSGELSHWNFSKMIYRRLQTLGSIREQSDKDPEGFFRATGLQSSSSFITSSTAYFPPRNVAEFLTDIFLQYAQTNYFYFSETIFRQKLDYYYSTQQLLTIEDAGWICTILMTMAIGTQFAYMQAKPASAKPPSSEEIPDDRIGQGLYRFSCQLIPDLITVASVETVSAFLLLGVYTLPIDTSGLAYTYYGLAIKMAIQNGMHRKFSGFGLDTLAIEIRNRLWWTAYSLESRISILHGRPVSVSASDTDADMPTDIGALRTPNTVTNLPNLTATICLTRKLSSIAAAILRLRRCPRSRQDHLLRQLMNIRTELRRWWSSQPHEIHCRDLNPDGPLFRCNVHLELTYVTALIYMGRPFIFLLPQSRHLSAHEAVGDTRAETVRTLTGDCIQSAIRIIELCQLLQDSVGLARISYTEFSSCRAALLALIAQRLNESSEPVSSALSRGMILIRQMCVGLESARSEVAVIEALERARQQLDNRSSSSDRGSTPSGSGYGQFQQWAKLWSVGPRESDFTVINAPSADTLETPNSFPLFDGFFSSFPQELDNFATIPGFEYDFVSSESVWPEDLGVSSLAPNEDLQTG